MLIELKYIQCVFKTDSSVVQVTFNKTTNQGSFIGKVPRAIYTFNHVIVVHLHWMCKLELLKWNHVPCTDKISNINIIYGYYHNACIQFLCTAKLSVRIGFFFIFLALCCAKVSIYSWRKIGFYVYLHFRRVNFNIRAFKAERKRERERKGYSSLSNTWTQRFRQWMKQM